MVTTEDILTRGYFPKELPPPFVTWDLARHFASLPKTKARSSLCLRYSYSKYATIRRTLSIPNPAHFVPLAKIVSTNWASIESHCSNSKISRTVPKPDTERAFTSTHSLDEIPAARTEIRTGLRYVVRADVSNFYGSLYTHTVPWAFHTKAVAKANKKSQSLFGNQVDQASQNIQSGQTIGLPVGPDTSFVIAESVLCEVDSFIQSRLPGDIQGFRFMDDYEFACPNLEKAELVRAIVQDSLAEFELQLNPRKTQIIELPDVLDTPWVHELAEFDLASTKGRVLESQLIRYFSRAFELVRQNPGEPVLKYAVRRLSEVDSTEVQTILEHLLFQAATVDPGTLHTALYVAFRNGYQFRLKTETVVMSRALSSIIQWHAPLQHGGDVAWALWGAIIFPVSLGTSVVEALEHLHDPIAILMALLAEEEGRLARKLDRSQWEQLATSSELFDRRWLLAYEAVGHGWLSPSGADPALSDPFFEDARAKSICFFVPNVGREIPEPSPTTEYE